MQCRTTTTNYLYQWVAFSSLIFLSLHLIQSHPLPSVKTALKNHKKVLNEYLEAKAATDLLTASLKQEDIEEWSQEVKKAKADKGGLLETLYSARVKRSEGKLLVISLSSILTVKKQYLH